MSATTVPAVRAALLSLLPAVVGTDVAVTYGHPGQDIPSSYVAVADTDAGVRREQRTMPLRQSSGRTETYDLRLVIWCQTGDSDSAAQRLMTEQSWLIAGQVDDFLRTNTTLGGVVQSALPTLFDDSDWLLNEGRAAQIVVSVSVTVVRS